MCHLLANCNYRLSARRFIQELFQDVTFEEVGIRLLCILYTNSEFLFWMTQQDTLLNIRSKKSEGSISDKRMPG